ncbi:polysaccharide biosynthesis C-terminal domain-containing protein [Haladaptatus sp. DJG-WS-42]|uniref:oligosaccharide flippase family protein n=1 Tax=Haladaptatus sp. DJG-WS-42 TaxID=3120516 RepID=UPI0030CEAC38
MQRSILSGFLSIFGSKVFILVLGLATTPILYRLMGPAQYGEYAFVLSIFMMFMIFVSSGVADGVRKYIPEDRTFDNWSGHVIGFYFRMGLVLALAGAGVLVLLAESGLVARFFSAEFVPYFYVLAVLVIVAQFRTFVRRTLMGFGLERYSEPLKILYEVTFVVIAIPAVYYGYGVMGALAGQVLGSALVMFLGFIVVHRKSTLLNVVRRTPRGFPWRELVAFNSLSIVLIFCLMSLYHTDILLLGALTDSTQVGHYKAALKLAEFLWFVPTSIQMVFVHSTSKMWSQNRTGQISELAARATRYTLLLTAVMALGLYSIAHIAVPVYFGEAATPAVEPLLLLLPGALGFAVARPILAIGQGKGDLKLPIIATATAAVINLGLNIVLIPMYGMHGAAIATSIGYASMFLFHIWSARKIGFNPLSDARLGRIALTTGLAAIPILALPSYIPQTLVPFISGDIVTLIVVPPVGLVIFLTLAFVTGALGIGEVLDILSSALPGSLARPVVRLRDRYESSGSMFGNDSLQYVLVFIGMVLFISGIAFAVMGPDLGSVDSPDVNVPGLNQTNDTSTAATQTPTQTDSTATTEPTEATTQTDDGGGTTASTTTTESATTSTATTEEPTTSTTTTTEEPTTSTTEEPTTTTTEEPTTTTTTEEPTTTTTEEPTTTTTSTTTTTTTSTTTTTTELVNSTTTESTTESTTSTNSTAGFALPVGIGLSTLGVGLRRIRRGDDGAYGADNKGREESGKNQ